MYIKFKHLHCPLYTVSMYYIILVKFSTIMVGGESCTSLLIIVMVGGEGGPVCTLYKYTCTVGGGGCTLCTSIPVQFSTVMVGGKGCTLCTLYKYICTV